MNTQVAGKAVQVFTVLSYVCIILIRAVGDLPPFQHLVDLYFWKAKDLS